MGRMIERPNQRRALLRLLAAVLYAVCILAPHVALALSGASGHCLTGDRQAAHVHTPADSHADETAATHENAGHGNADHAHPDGAFHVHAGQDSPAAPDIDSHTGMCCGLFCVTGLAVTSAPLLSAPMRAEHIAPGLDRGLTGRAPDRINRPPIA
jgi:hypothetical protein